jgi:predicted transcriptional regulator
MYIYASAPIQAATGYAIIETVERIPPEEIWSRYSQVACIKRDDFTAYYCGASLGFVLVLTDPTPFANPVPLSALKAKLGFTPPQSFAYADDAFKQLVHGVQQ